MPNDINPIGQRISAVLNDLKNLRKISGDKDISVALGYKSASSITEMKKGRCAPTVEFLDLMEGKYKVSRKFILEGIDPKFIDGHILETEAGHYVERIFALEAALKVLILLFSEERVARTGEAFSDVSLDVEHRIKREVKRGMVERGQQSF